MESNITRFAMEQVYSPWAIVSVWEHDSAALGIKANFWDLVDTNTFTFSNIRLGRWRANALCMRYIPTALRKDRRRGSSRIQFDLLQNFIRCLILGALFPAISLIAGDIPPSASPITIAVVDHTRRVTSFDGKGSIQPILDAVNVQISRDLSPAWGVNAVLVLKDQPDADNWTLELLDHIDIYEYPAPLGYHTIGPNGKPLGKVAVLDAMLSSWASKVISHEALEMLVNPYLDRRILVLSSEDEQVGRLYWPEICDPTDEYDRYDVNGYMVSDFVYPSFYSTTGKRPFNFRGNLVQPLKPAMRGYVYSQAFRYTDNPRIDIGPWMRSPSPRRSPVNFGFMTEWTERWPSSR
jgi:hypothetical protein